MTREMTGAEMVIQALADQGVKHIFGYPGGAVLPIYDALFAQDKVQHILVRHEQGAVHAAEGYARSTGKVGCVLVTSGPGATNAVTGLTDALMRLDPARLHHRPGADASDRQRRLPGMRHGRHHAAVHQAQLSGEAHRGPAARAARGVPHRAERAGPARSWSTSPRTSSSPPASIRSRTNSSTQATSRKLKGDLDKIKAAVELMAQAKRPLFYTGGGVINSGPQRQRAAARAGQAHRLSDHLDADGARRLSGRRSAMARHARHARHLRSQHGDARLRRDDLRRRALRRPHHRPARRLLARLEEDPHRHRPVLDQQERPGRSRRSSATARMCWRTWCGCGGTGAKQADKKALDGWWKQIDNWRARKSLAYQAVRTRSSSRNTPSSGSTS